MRVDEVVLAMLRDSGLHYELVNKSRHIVIWLAGRPVQAVPRSQARAQEGRAEDNARACVRRAIRAAGGLLR